MFHICFLILYLSTKQRMCKFFFVYKIENSCSKSVEFKFKSFGCQLPAEEGIICALRGGTALSDKLIDYYSRCRHVEDIDEDLNKNKNKRKIPITRDCHARKFDCFMQLPSNL